MNINSLDQVFEKCNNKPVAFMIKGSPDPDAIASSLALLSYYQSVGGEGTIYHEDYVSHTANKAMLNVLDIRIKERQKGDPLEEDFYVVCDHTDPEFEGVDLSKCILHVDHHKGDIDPPENCKTIIEHDVGACSSLITLALGNEFFSNISNASQLATALCYGIKTDTDNLDAAREKDYDAMKILANYSSKDNLQKITKSRISTQTAEVFKTALTNEKMEQNWIHTGVGFLQETYRDSIAQVADELMRRQGVDSVLVYGIIEKAEGPVVEGSIRSIDAGFDIEGFVKNFSESSGGRKYKGGFTIPLGFWGKCNDREKMEEYVNLCMEDTLRSVLGTASTGSKKKKIKASNG